MVGCHFVRITSFIRVFSFGNLFLRETGTIFAFGKENTLNFNGYFYEEISDGFIMRIGGQYGMCG